MQRPDIVFGLQNAIQKGESLDHAKQTFIDAGYPIQDINDSVQALNSGVITELQPQSQQLTTSAQPALQTQLQQSQQTTTTQIPHQTPQAITPSQSQTPQPQTPSSSTNVTMPSPLNAIQPSGVQTDQPIETQETSQTLLVQTTQSEDVSNVLIITLIIVLALAFAGLMLTIFAQDFVVSLLEKIGIM